MKYVTSICVMLTLSIAACGQQPGANPHVATPSEPQPDQTGQRLQHLRQTAYELEQAGNRDQAAAVRQQADRERQALLRRLDALQAEVEQIRQAIGAGTQVIMQLQVFEISLTKLRRLGFDVEEVIGDPNAKLHVNQTMGNAQLFSVINDGSEAQQFLEALRKDNLVKVLAEPTLVTLSGRTAVFNSGGELPVPKPRQDGSVAIEHQYGTLVELTPEVLGDKVHLAIHCRLAELDYEHMVRAGKETVPGVQVREFNTRTELKSGQTLVICGLIQDRVEATERGVPYVSSIPCIGAMFRSVEEMRNEVAMLILVRPEIVQSLATAARLATTGPKGDVPAPQQPVRLLDALADAPSATAPRPADGDTRR